MIWSKLVQTLCTMLRVLRKAYRSEQFCAISNLNRTDKLGYNTPIEVYEHKYYRYADKDYSITNMPMSHNDFEMMQEAIDMLRQLEDFEVFAELPDIIGRLQDKLAISRNKRKPIKISTVCRT